MATSKSLSSISRWFCRNLQKPSHYHPHFTKTMFSTGPSTFDFKSELDEFSAKNSDSELDESTPVESPTESTPVESPTESFPSTPESTRPKGITDISLEGGLDVGIYKAIIVGQVGQNPLQKRQKNGRMVTLMSVGTGGIRNERIPFPNEEPREYADRCSVQWHRVAVYPDRLGEIVMKHALPGAIIYLEGNLETKIYTDQLSGLVRRVREIAIRHNGRVVFLGKDDDFNQPPSTELRGVGYF